MFRLLNKPVSNKNNNSKLVFRKNNSNKPVFRRNNSDSEIRFGDNNVEYDKK